MSLDERYDTDVDVSQGEVTQARIFGNGKAICISISLTRVLATVSCTRKLLRDPSIEKSAKLLELYSSCLATRVGSTGKQGYI